MTLDPNYSLTLCYSDLLVDGKSTKKGKDSESQQPEEPVITEYEQRRLERIEECNARISEIGFAHRFLIRPSSHEEPVVKGVNNDADEVPILS